MTSGSRNWRCTTTANRRSLGHVKLCRIARIRHLAQNPGQRGRIVMEVRLDGRTAIITGSSKGLGLAMAKEFAASGADVAILARNPGGLAEAQATVAAG